MKKNPNSFVKLGLCIFTSGAALILLYYVIHNFPAIKAILDAGYSILSPFVYGLAIAYLLCPVYNFVEKLVNKKHTKQKLAKTAASLAALIVLFGFVGGLLWLILPETFRSVTGLAQTLTENAGSLIDWAERFFTADDSQLAAMLEALVTQLSARLTDWINNSLLPELGSYVTKTFTGAWATAKTLLNIVVGVFVCVYFLNSKDTFKAQARKVIVALCSRERAEDIFEFCAFTDIQFGGFLKGKLIDSLIIGILCAILMSILRLPYVLLISTIVGITNVIPFFGPFIGAIPGILILLLESPIKALTFGIMILALQQFDGNFLGPKILGKTSGLANFWVLFAILVFGGLFGFVGMLVGVPLFAVIYYYCRKYINGKLLEKKLAVDTNEYRDGVPWSQTREENDPATDETAVK